MNNGNTSNCTRYQRYGNSVSYYCQSGYHLVGSSNGTSQSDGSWSPSPPTCVRGTPCLCPSQPSNGYTSYCSHTAAVGSRVNYYCNSGYYHTKGGSATCLPYGNWTTAPVCEQVRPCPCPQSPINGFTNCNGSHLAGTGSRVTYSCNSGYTLSGSSYRTCQASGNWTGTDLICVRGCICPSAPVNGYTDDCSGTKPVDSILLYHCNTGYSMFSTNTSRICQSDGEWSGVVPKCEKDHCSCPFAPLNGQITNCSGTPKVGFLVSYQYKEEYILQGNSSRMCQPGGSWTGTDPTCSKSEANPLPLKPPNEALSIVFGIFFFITLLIVVGIIMAVIAWHVRKRTKKVQKESESINFSSLQEADENSYQKVDVLNQNQENASLPGNEGSESIL